ncbi:uncharacterized protein LOC144877740 [Branchiostoma floridae x Branchiostoma japonicum]
MSKLLAVALVAWTVSCTVTSVDGCGGTLSVSPGGVLTSPNYPGNYGYNERCEWLITGPLNSRIRLTFNSFETYHAYDSLYIYDGDSSNAVELQRLFGYHPSISPITSTFNAMFLRFTSNSYSNDRGFQISYTSLELSYTSHMHKLTVPPGGVLTSPNFPNNYGSASEPAVAEWLITAPAFTRIRLTFDSFSTASRDYLYIYDGDSFNAVQLQRLSGRLNSVSPITSTLNVMFLWFASWPQTANQGFQITYTSVESNYTSHIYEPEYLTSIGEWNFYKVPAIGPMTNANVKATCQAVAMYNPCSYTGYETCRHGRTDCITFDGGSASCRTLNVISDLLCGNIEPHTCKPLDDTFVYYPGWQSDDSAFGVDYDTGHWGMTGANYTDKYALCAGHQEYLTAWDGWMFFKIRTLGTMSNDNIQTTCERLGMHYPCWYTGHDPCDARDYWNPSCVKFDHASGDCQTTKSLSDKLCGTTVDYNCPALNHTFVYYPSGSYSSGIRYGSSNTLSGNIYSDMYALCAARQCLFSPCVHGTCVHWFEGFSCLCDEDWAGEYCDTVIDDCASNPCMSGGTCVDEVGDYSCVCHPHTTGKNCESVLHIDKCYHFSNDSLTYKDASTTCNDMGGHLADIKDSGDQQLLASYIQTGHAVSTWTSTSTSVSPFGTCDCGDDSAMSAKAPWMQKSANTDICLLLDSSVGFMGTYQSCKEQHQYVCESNVTSCQPNMCQNGGICSSCFDNSTIFCTCPEGYIGSYCETVNHCDPNPCPFGWTCSLSQTNGIHCIVPDGVRATSSGFCTASSCGEGWNCREDGPAGYSCIRG